MLLHLITDDDFFMPAVRGPSIEHMQAVRDTRCQNPGLGNDPPRCRDGHRLYLPTREDARQQIDRGLGKEGIFSEGRDALPSEKAPFSPALDQFFGEHPP